MPTPSNQSSSTTTLLTSARKTKALAARWLGIWWSDPLLFPNALPPLAVAQKGLSWAVIWLVAIQQNALQQQATGYFWHWVKTQATTKNHWNQLILALEEALLEVENLETVVIEQLLNAALIARQQHELKQPVKRQQSHNLLTNTPPTNSKLISMNQEQKNYQDLLQRTIDASFCRIAFDRSGAITDINQNMVHLLEYDKAEELIGEQANVITGRERNEENRAEFWGGLVEGETKEGQFRCLTKYGNEVWIQASYTPISDETGEVVQIVNIGMDITQQRRETQSAQALKEAVDRSFARIEYDMNGQIIDGNQAFLNAAGYDSMEAINNSDNPMFMEESFVNSTAYEQLWENLRKGESQSAEFKRVKASGESIWTQAVFAPVRDEEGKVERVIEIASDITNQKDFLQEVNRIIEIAGQEGKLDARLDARNAAGDWKTLASSVNLLLESVALPVSELGEVVVALAQGDLTVEFDSFVEGDIKELGDELNIAIKSMASLMQQISQIGDLVAASAEEMLVKGEEMKNTTLEVASATQQMAEGAQQQAQQTDEASKMMDTVLISVESMAKKAGKINASAMQGQEHSAQGLDTIQLVAKNMNQIQDSAKSTSTSIETFAERSEEIASALSVITDIASQTNLLALNAAIEAARAGDAGRGFAVVAEEIRKLAEGSRRSAVDIEKVIREIHKDIGAASKAMDYMERSVKNGLDATQQAEDVFGSIETANKETLELSKEIVEATTEQRASIHATAKNIEKIVIVAEETASGTEQVASSSRVLSQGMNEVTATSEDLANVATQLQENISKFKIPE